MRSLQPSTTPERMKRFYYKGTIKEFLDESPQGVLGQLTQASAFSVERTQTDAWLAEIGILKGTLDGLEGTVYFEYSIPRMGRRIDVLALIGAIVFVLEFKVGATEFDSSAIDQVWDYALDLKNFHEATHNLFVAPILIATGSEFRRPDASLSYHSDRLLFPICREW